MRSPFKDKLKQQQTVSIDMVNLEAKEQDNFISDLHPVIETEEQSWIIRELITFPDTISVLCSLCAPDINTLSMSALLSIPLDFIFF